jgi:hypothetical protein
VRGCILFNGNIQFETDFVKMAREWLTSSRHQDQAVRTSRKVLLITAGWLEHEYEEGHVKAALNQIGLPSRFEGGYDVNLQNLGVYHAYRQFLAAEPHLAELYQRRLELIESTRNLYLQRNTFYIALLRRALRDLKERFPDLSLARVMRDVTREFTHAPAEFDGNRLLAYYMGRDIHDTIMRLVDNDDRLYELLRELDEHFVEATGLHYHPLWRTLRQELEQRILSSNSIFIFGGHLGTLHRCLTFFRLRDAMVEALRRGTCFYTVSAGSVMLCERLIIYNDFPSELGPGLEFQMADRGLGLVRQMQVFPHCNDRIQTDDPDNLSYLAYRFQNQVCVGLNKDSFLLLEGAPEWKATSVGKRDGVYVFDTSGAKVRYDYGQTIPLGADGGRS